MINHFTDEERDRILAPLRLRLVMSMIQPLLFTLFIAILSSVSLLNVAPSSLVTSVSTESESSTTSLSHQRIHHPSTAALVSSRLESPRLPQTQSMLDENEQTLTETGAYLELIHHSLILLLYAGIVVLAAPHFLRKALQFLNLYSRFAHA